MSDCVDAIYEEQELPLEFQELAAGLSVPPATSLEEPPAEDLPEDLPDRTAHKSQFGTPQDLFDRLHQVHGFTLDAAALASNAKCPRFCVPPREALHLLGEYGPGIQRADGSLALPDGRVALVDGLAVSWAGGTVFVNPPYSWGEIPKWCEKARQEAQRGATVVMLLLSDTSTDWYHDLVVPHAEVEFLRRRVRFVDPWTGKLAGVPKFGSIIATYRPPPALVPAGPPPRLIAPLPRRRTSITVTAPLGRGHLHVTLGHDEDGDPCEVFVHAGHSGSDLYAHTEAIGRLVSAALQLPLAPGHRRLEVVAHLVEQLRGIGGQDERTVASVLATVLEETWLRRDAA